MSFQTVETTARSTVLTIGEQDLSMVVYLFYIQRYNGNYPDNG